VRLAPCIATIAIGLVVATAHPTSALARRQDATALAVAADAAHAAGRHREAADLYARAYRAMTAEEKRALGEVMIAAALDDFHASFEATDDASVADTASELLAEYEGDTRAPPPETLARHRAWIDRAGHVPEPAPAIVEDDDAPPIAARIDDDERQRPPDRAAPPRERERVAPALIGLGVAAAIGGAAMIGVGAPLGRRADRMRDEAFSHPDYLARDPEHPDTKDYVAGVHAFVEREELRTRVFVAVGSVLVTAGVGVAIYGAVRLARHRRGTPRESARVRPILGGVAF
jgi:hypothetical protein